MTTDTGDSPHEPHFAVYCEIQDAGLRPGNRELDQGEISAAAAVEFAMLLTDFDDKIPDQQRERIIALAGALMHFSGILDGQA